MYYKSNRHPLTGGCTMPRSLRNVFVATPVSASHLAADPWLMFRTFAQEIYTFGTDTNGGVYVVAKNKGNDQRLAKELAERFPGRFRHQEVVL